MSHGDHSQLQSSLDVIPQYEHKLPWLKHKTPQREQKYSSINVYLHKLRTPKLLKGYIAPKAGRNANEEYLL